MGAFKVISADSHIVEPPDMYTSRIEPRFRERAPRIERHKTPVGREYDAWVLDGVQVGTLGAVMQAGQRARNRFFALLSWSEQGEPIRSECRHRAAADAAARRRYRCRAAMRPA
jgi:hypothetical protein